MGIIHCTGSRFANSFLVDKWHRANQWGLHQHGLFISAGYHYLISNAYPWNNEDKYPELDGQISILRGLYQRGAHCAGANWHVGIAFVGGKATLEQQAALVNLCRSLLKRGVIKGVYGHDEIRLSQTKLPKGCPGIDMDDLRDLIFRGSR